MANQTYRPCQWVIVDDGSTDSTPAILEDFCRKYAWARLLRRPPGLPRQPGAAVVNAFNYGLADTQDTPYDLIAKLDCDLSFPIDYFERLLARFEADKRLGIASGVYLEQDGSTNWRVVEMPPYHAAGAAKLIRRKCFEDIGGFVPSRGWDTLDEIKAGFRGWRTTHFSDLAMHHWKPEGSGIGTLKTSVMHGEVYYLTGGDPLIFLLKAAKRLTSVPYLVSALALIYGYFSCIFKCRSQLVSPEEARYYRKLMRARLWREVCQLF